MKRYKVTLTTEERGQLQDLIAAGKAAAQKLARARVLLKADASPGGPAWPDLRIAEAIEVGVATVERLRRRFVEDGFDVALRPQPVARLPRKIDGTVEAHLVALACSDPPQGRDTWTLRLLADQLVELQVVDTISTETVRQVLKKTRSSRG